MAIGDSFTEGIGDERVDGSPRGWADLVAAGLAAGGPPVEYANLAVRGRLLEPIVTGQLEAALALTPAPTLITFNGGGNDMMRQGVDGRRLVDLTEHVIRSCAAAGVRLVLLSGADPSDGLPFGGTVRRRGKALTAAVAGLARRHDFVFVDVFNDAEIRRAPYWSPDRLHLGPDGHRRVASLVLAALGHDVAAHAVAPTPADPRRLSTEVRYYREHVLPWLARRARGRSSGDNRLGKHVAWTTVETPHPA
ncbi:SGNH/GDSL hydrolase family protein [Saccharothrix violaceirubra]|uniref:Lysophospholipase L1-like esterase n=1 Tax=Saccharothrix violaceirubra TaxID=413306 RepID=A0A7W7T356_9PSEU|nr:SGNH/GDSL hydrolase family protein [Saccharothrix violaceirubra]MBB4965713.1 lysophospholipase L1-like esterase [Saccharothrix violaceirubra]